MPPRNETARKSARVYGPPVLAAVVSGTSFAEIAEADGLTLKQIERFLRMELRKRWVAPAQDHARLQIARLDAIAAKLKAPCDKGDLPAIDRLLKVLDRLDRYHGVVSLAAEPTVSRGDVRQALARLIERASRVPTLEG